MVGAGLSGLASALHLRSTGREVTVLEQQCSPGGRHHTLEIDGFRFDTGPMVSLSPESMAAPLHAVGERLKDWIDIMPIDPICRAHYPDGTTLDVFADPERTAAEIARLCGGREARAYQRFLSWAPYRVPAGLVLHDPRTLRLFGGRSLFGFSPVGGCWWPSGGAQAVARMLASVSEKHGISVRYQTRLCQWDKRDDRVVAVLTDDGERLATDGVVLPGRRARNGPSWLVLHLGSTAGYSKIAHRNVHFGQAWQRSKREVLVRGELMRDPTVLVSSPSRTDHTAAPPGQHVYQVVVPVPDLKTAPLDWHGPATRAYAGEVMATLEARGYLDLGASLRVSYVVTPADWAREGMNYGVPGRSVAANVVIAGAGLESGRQAAQRVVAVA